MAKIPYFQFYPDDYLSSPGVTTCDLIDEGVYIRLLAYSWKHEGCHLPDDMNYLRRLCKGIRKQIIERVLNRHFERIELSHSVFIWRNARLHSEFVKFLNLSESNASKAKSRWNKEKHNATALPVHMPNGCLPEPEPKPEPYKSKAEAGEVPPSAPEIKKSKRVLKMNDTEWLLMVKANPAYSGIDVDRVQAKLQAWCATKGKEPTRSRLLNWLNREEKPMGGSSHGQRGNGTKPDNENTRTGKYSIPKPGDETIHVE